MDDVAEERVGLRPLQQTGGPASLGVAGPGHDPSEAVLPSCQQRIALGTLQDNIRCGARRGGDIAGQWGKAAERHPWDHIGQRAELWRDLALHDPGLERLAGLFQEDLRHV